MAENEDFNIEKHLRGLADKYCEGMPEDEKAKLLDRITSNEGNKKYSVFENRSENDPLHIVSDKGQKVYELSELSDFPTAEQLNEMEAEGKLLPNKKYVADNNKGWFEKIKQARHNKKFRQHQEREKRVEGIIKKLAGNDSKISKDLAKILDENETDLVIRIRNWKRPNASVAFQKSEGETKNKVVLMVSDKLFQGKNQKALVGFLAHEMSHVLDFGQRPDSAKTQYMDGAETFADIAGTQLAVNAGLDSRGFGKYMGDDYRKTKIEYNYTASGTFREETINTAYNSMVKVRDNEKTKDAKSQEGTDKKKERKDGLKIMELQGRVSQSTDRTASRPNQQTHLQGITLSNYRRTSDGR